MKKIYYELRRIFLILFVFLFSPLIYFLIWQKKRSDLPGRSDLKILVIPHLTRIGDLVCATPVFRAIKEKYPDSHLAVLAAGRLKGLLKNNPRVDEIIVYRHYDLLGTIRQIREKNFDWSFVLSGTSVGSVISFLALIPKRAKITRRPRPLSEFLTDWLANYKLRYEHHTYLPRYYLRLLEFIGIKDPEEIKEVFVSEEGERKAEEFLRKNNLNPSDFLVGVSATAGNKIKEWGGDKFKRLAEALIQKYEAKVIFIGSANFSLEEFPSLMKRLKLFIAVDTGPIYMVHALKIPLIDIIGPVDPAEQPPKDKRSIQVLPPPYIKPTSFVFKKPGKDHRKALEAITVDDVLLAVDNLAMRGVI